MSSDNLTHTLENNEEDKDQKVVYCKDCSHFKDNFCKRYPPFAVILPFKELQEGVAVQWPMMSPNSRCCGEFYHKRKKQQFI